MEQTTRPSDAVVGHGLLARLIRPARSVTGAYERPRARTLITIALALAILLTVSAVMSFITSAVAPRSPTTLGYPLSSLVLATAIGFWVSYWLAKRPHYLIGAWVMILTIIGFLAAFSVARDAGASLMAGLAMAALAATIFLGLRGTLWMAGLAIAVGFSFILYIPRMPDWIYSFGVLVVIVALTLLLSLMREDDLRQLERLRDLEALETDRLRSEATLARTVQMAMIPAHLPELDGIDLAAYSEPAKEASGDFYDVFLVEEGEDPLIGSLVIMVCDVAGKGMASALVAAAARSALRSEAERDASPSSVLERVNHQLAGSIPSRLFVTMFFGVLDLTTGVLRFASGGHPHPYRWSPATGVLSTLRSDGLPIGIVADADYPEQQIHLEPGEVVVAYTDGLVEALDGDRELYGFDRLAVDVEEALADERPVEERLAAIISAMTAFTGGEPPADDVTVVAVARPGVTP